jgi:hypothetical protein
MDADAAAIRDVLDAFAQAHRDRSSASLKTLQPSLTTAELAAFDRTFAENDSYDYRVLQPRISIQADAATVTCLIVRRLSTVPGATPRQLTHPATFELSRDREGRWVVQAHRIAP